MMHNAISSHSQADTQSVPRKGLPPPLHKLLTVFKGFFHMISYGMKYPFCQVRSAVSSQLLVALQTLTGRTVQEVETS